MQWYQLVGNAVKAVQWTEETHGQVVAWLQDHGYSFHVHDENGDVGTDRPPVAICIDDGHGGDLELELGWWLIYDPDNDRELSYELPGCDDAWTLV